MWERGSTCQTFDDLRFSQHSHGKCLSITDLPPTSASIHDHISRALYQTHLILHFFENYSLFELDVEKYGYMMKEGQLLPKRVSDIYPPTSSLIPNCTNCTNCSRQTCICVTYKIPCCAFCSCHVKSRCKNPVQ